MSALNLLLENIDDAPNRENFQKINDFIVNEQIINAGFKSFEINFTAARTNARIPHRLGFQPTDIIQTSLTGPGTVTYNYSSFTTEFLDITTSDAVKVRFLAGNLGLLKTVEQ